MRLVTDAALFCLLCAAGLAAAAAIYPIDRASILAGSRFDFKVEFDSVVDPAAVRVTVNGVDAAQAQAGELFADLVTPRRQDRG